jgi:bis(5'-nucleosyl)-tetraphosphatase (symmetrical)
MSTYVIGDVHGCFRTLEALLHKLPFDPEHDRLWMVGDLVNRGPDSAAVLRWARRTAERLGDRFVCVLGNHDIHLLARLTGADPRPRDTLDDVLQAPDRAELIDWLYEQPLLHREGETVLVHAGLLPQWTVDEAQSLAREVQEALHSPAAKRILNRYATPPLLWRSDFTRGQRRDRALAVFTLVRTIDRRGTPHGDYTGPPDQCPPGTFPWFAASERRSVDHRIVFGHWAALGLEIAPGIRALDTGCIWGGKLTALRLEDDRIFQVESELARPSRPPGRAPSKPRPEETAP